MRPKGGPDPIILGFDVSGPWISTGLWSDGPRAAATVPMAKGQGESLFAEIEARLSEAGLSRHDLDLVAVGVGPGNFTGIRIAVSAARGLALALGVPAVGVTLFETVLDATGPLADPALIVSLEAPRAQAYVQHFRYGIAQAPPRQIDPEAPPADLELPMNMAVRGYRAEAIARPFHAGWTSAAPQEIGLAVARMADTRRLHCIPGPDRPVPLYVRPADAEPPRDLPPRLLP